jgi:arsenate reductase
MSNVGTLVVWGIPSCGTVKKARAHLEARGLPYDFRDLRATPPTAAQVARWVEVFGARAMRNTSGGSYRALPADKDAWSDDAWARAFVADPMLLKRPILERDGVPLAVGFKDDAVRALDTHRA